MGLGFLISVALISTLVNEPTPDQAAESQPPNPSVDQPPVTIAPPRWAFRKTTETSGATSFIFNGDAKPPLALDSDNNAHLKSIADVNAALTFLKLPLITETRPDKGYAENSRFTRGQYHWPDYQLGPLVITRTLATNKRTYDNYDAVWKVTIRTSGR